MSTDKNKRIKRATRLNRVAEHILAPVLRKQGKLFEIIVKNWTHIGGNAAPWSLPLAIHFPDGGAKTGNDGNDPGVLSIGIPSARAPELQMLSADIIERANGHVGYMALSHIRINQSLHNIHSPASSGTTATTPAVSRPTVLTPPVQQPAWQMDETQKSELEAMISTIKDTSLRQQLMAMLSTRLSSTKTP